MDTPQSIDTDLVGFTGFPSPALDEMRSEADLYSHLVKNRVATKLLRVKGDAMKDSRIYDDDVLVVDSSIKPRDGSIVLARIGSRFWIARLRKKLDGIYLVSDEPKGEQLKISEDENIYILGVVTFSLHKQI